MHKIQYSLRALACLLALLLARPFCCSVAYVLLRRANHCVAKVRADCPLGGGSLELRHALRNFPRRDTTQAASSCVSVPRHTSQTYEVKVLVTDRLGCREPPRLARGANNETRVRRQCSLLKCSKLPSPGVEPGLSRPQRDVLTTRR